MMLTTYKCHHCSEKYSVYAAKSYIDGWSVKYAFDGNPHNPDSIYWCKQCVFADLNLIRNSGAFVHYEPHMCGPYVWSKPENISRLMGIPKKKKYKTPTIEDATIIIAGAISEAHLTLVDETGDKDIWASCGFDPESSKYTVVVYLDGWVGLTEYSGDSCIGAARAYSNLIGAKKSIKSVIDTMKHKNDKDL